MKELRQLIKQAVVALLFVLSKASIAQITITQSDMALPGTILMNGFDTSYSAGPGPAGANQSWNFSGLLSSFTNTIQFKAPGGEPGAAYFPGSNLCLVSVGDSSREFLSVTSSGFWVDGMYSSDTNNPIPLLKYDPKYELITFPAAYGTSSNSISQYSITMPGSPPYNDSIKYQVTYAQNSVIDAWGALSLPMGVYNVIRQNITAITKDSIFYFQSGAWVFDSELTDTTYDYRWWTNGIGFPIVELTSSASNPYHGANFISSYTAGISVYNQVSSQLKVFPNPAQGVVTLIVPAEETTVILTDMMGNTVSSQKIKSGVGHIDVSNLKNGIYYIVDISKDGTLCTKEKLIVAH